MKDQIQMRIAIPSVKNAHRESKNNNLSSIKINRTASVIIAIVTILTLLPTYGLHRPGAVAQLRDDRARSLSIPEGSDGGALMTAHWAIFVVGISWFFRLAIITIHVTSNKAFQIFLMGSNGTGCIHW